MKALNVLVTILVLTATLAVTGCSSVADSNADSSSSHPGTTETYNDADVKFATMMIPHHEQAIEMSDLLLAKHDAAPPVLALAQKIKDAQGPEIEQLQAWLDAWGADPGSHHGSHDMEGMMTEEDMAALEAASGPEASTLFLKQMIQHHDGAVAMAQAHLKTGANPNALTLAQTIIDAQTTEIRTMRELLDDKTTK